jgi:hypothetical protein
MYHFVLVLHSWIRWLVLLSLIYALYRSYRGWLYGKKFLAFDNTIRQTTSAIAQLQMVLGVWLYLISPVIHYFLHFYKDAVHQRQIRFFGMEHSAMMVVAVTLIIFGAATARRKIEDRLKFKTMAIWFSIALLVLLINIPWPFSPFAGRPLFRTF